MKNTTANSEAGLSRVKAWNTLGALRESKVRHMRALEGKGMHGSGLGEEGQVEHRDGPNHHLSTTQCLRCTQGTHEPQ